MSKDALPPSLAEKLKRGELFEGKYRMLKALGQGSFASVLHARHEAMDRDVALKVLRPDVVREHPEVAERFITESRLASRLSSAHTVTSYDFGETEEGVPYMVLEYVDGRPLDYVIEKYDGLGMKRSVRLVRQVLESLQEAHDHNIIHRDLKPANVMVAKGTNGDGVQAKVLDFGVAKLVEDANSGVELDVDASGRRSTQFIGTPRYMSPEQILGREISPASDLYSLGLIFFEMCTGRDAVPSDNVAEVAQIHLSDDPLEFDGLDEMPEVLQRIVLKATARQPEDRFQSARQFSEALDEALQSGRRRHEQAQRVPDKPESPNNQRGDRTSEVFSGDAYVAPPDEEEIEKASSSPGRRKSTPPRPGSRAAPSRNKRRKRSGNPHGGSSSAAAAGSGRSVGSGELELDIESVERQREHIERRKRYGSSREEFARKAADAENRPGLLHWFGSGLAIVVLSYVGFVIVAGSTGALGSVTRSVLGLMVPGLALVWAVFSENAYRDFARKVMVPWARRSVTTVLLAVVLLGVVMPVEASESLRYDGLWFFETWPPGLRLNWLVGFTEAICDGAAILLEAVGAFVPWSH